MKELLKVLSILILLLLFTVSRPKNINFAEQERFKKRKEKKEEKTERMNRHYTMFIIIKSFTTSLKVL